RHVRRHPSRRRARLHRRAARRDAAGRLCPTMVRCPKGRRMTPKKVLFACIHNAGRSQMAAALFNASADVAKARAISAGTQPGPHVHPEVLTSMRELGIDLSHAQPTLLTDDLARDADLLVTMGCGEACPAVPGLR